MPRPHKIVKLGLEEKVHELRNQGLGYEAISNVIAKEYNVKISHMSIKRYFESVEIKPQTPKVRKKIANGKLNTISQLFMINKETLEILEEAKVAGDLKTALKAIERVEKQLELQAKLLGDIKDAPTTIVINVTKVDAHAN